MMTKKSDNDAPVPIIFENSDPISIQQSTAKCIHIWLSGEIGEESKYIKILSVCQTAEAGDRIYIHLNSPGGYVSTAIQLYSALKNCEAEITAVIESDCHSAASIIAMAADNFHVLPLCSMLIHNFSGGAVGKFNDIQRQVDFDKRQTEKIFREVYANFLTEDEIKEVLEGKDLWLNADDIDARLTKLFDCKNKEIEDNVQTIEKFKKRVLSALKSSKKFEKEEIAEFEKVLSGM